MFLFKRGIEKDNDILNYISILSTPMHSKTSFINLITYFRILYYRILYSI